MKRFWILIAVAALVGCRGDAAAPGKPAPDSHDEEAAHGGEPAVHVTAEMQQQWGISVGAAETTSLTGTVTLPGILTLNQDETAEISAIVAGKVVSIGAALGAPVRAKPGSRHASRPRTGTGKIALVKGRARLHWRRASSSARRR